MADQLASRMLKPCALVLLSTSWWSAMLPTPAYAIDEDAVSAACKSGHDIRRPQCLVACRQADREGVKDGFSNVMRKNCNFILRSVESREITTGKGCSKSHCIYLLKSSSKNAWKGHGFTLTYRNFDGATYEYDLVDPKGRRSKFTQCGTCEALEWEAGPLKSAELVRSDAGYTVKVSKSELR